MLALATHVHVCFRVSKMDDFSVREMTKLAISYDTTDSVVQTKRMFRAEFQEIIRKPDRKFIENYHKRFLEKGSTLKGTT